MDTDTAGISPPAPLSNVSEGSDQITSTKHGSAAGFTSQMAARLEDLVCAVCLAYAWRPVRTPDCGGTVGHVFCSRCLKRYLMDKAHPACPLCRKPLDQLWTQQLPIDETLSEELATLCWYKLVYLLQYDLAPMLLVDVTATGSPSLRELCRVMQSIEPTLRHCYKTLSSVCVPEVAVSFPVQTQLEHDDLLQTNPGINCPTVADCFGAVALAIDRHKPYVRVVLSRLCSTAGWLWQKGYRDPTAGWAQYCFDIIYNCCTTGPLSDLQDACEAYLSQECDRSETGIYWTCAFPTPTGIDASDQLMPGQALSSIVASPLPHLRSKEPGLIIDMQDDRLRLFFSTIRNAPKHVAGVLAEVACAYAAIVENTCLHHLTRLSSKRPTFCAIPAHALPRLNTMYAYTMYVRSIVSI
jgi:hypothetical protein